MLSACNDGGNLHQWPTINRSGGEVIHEKGAKFWPRNRRLIETVRGDEKAYDCLFRGYGETGLWSRRTPQKTPRLACQEKMVFKGVRRC